MGRIDKPPRPSVSARFHDGHADSSRRLVQRRVEGSRLTLASFFRSPLSPSIHPSLHPPRLPLSVLEWEWQSDLKMQVIISAVRV